MVTRIYDSFQGLSTDIKPTEDVGYNSIFLEVDTFKIWIYDRNINPITNNGWWEI